MRRWIGALGVVMAAPFFLWLPAGLLAGVPSLVDVFGIAGLRTPAAVTVLGLLLAAVAFWDR